MIVSLLDTVVVVVVAVTVVTVVTAVVTVVVVVDVTVVTVTVVGKQCDSRAPYLIFLLFLSYVLEDARVRRSQHSL